LLKKKIDIIAPNVLYPSRSASSSEQLNLKENDMFLLTSQTADLIGIAQGFVKTISNNKRTFQLLCDKNLASVAHKSLREHLFRIDKVNFRSAISLNYTNLARLMTNGSDSALTTASARSANLRKFIIDKQAPTFDTTLPRQHIMANKSLFSKLNRSQQSAIIKVS
jgi:hypothetical protein